jgi:hypothetical protein
MGKGLAVVRKPFSNACKSCASYGARGVRTGIRQGSSVNFSELPESPYVTVIE